MMCGDRWLETGSPWEGDEMTEREQFENFVVLNNPFHQALLARKNVRGEYVSETAQAHWETWQAARATPALPQGVEEWIAEHGLQYVDTLGGYGVKLKRSSELKYPCPEYVSVDDLRSYLSGMAIVPVERLTVEWANKNVVVPPEVKGRVMSEMFWRGVYAMLAAAKEKQS